MNRGIQGPDYAGRSALLRTALRGVRSALHPTVAWRNVICCVVCCCCCGRGKGVDSVSVDNGCTSVEQLLLARGTLLA